nr:hypothetical protein [Tanacetum cinerariifolium]
MKWYDYDYLEETEVQREDHKLYKFKEGDFLRLNMHDIEDIVLLLVQKQIFNLERDDIFDLDVALKMFTRRVVILKWVEDLQLGVKSYQKMFTRRVVILKWVEDLQLGVKSYQKKLNITKPETFSDGTLTSVRSVLHDIASNLRMDYLPKRRWSNLDKYRSRIMIKAIDKLQLERRLMRSLEKFVGGRDYEEYFRLLERTI